MCCGSTWRRATLNIARGLLDFPLAAVHPPCFQTLCKSPQGSPKRSQCSKGCGSRPSRTPSLRPGGTSNAGFRHGIPLHPAMVRTRWVFFRVSTLQLPSRATGKTHSTCLCRKAWMRAGSAVYSGTACVKTGRCCCVWTLDF
jgi:hypothetical protein